MMQLHYSLERDGSLVKTVKSLLSMQSTKNTISLGWRVLATAADAKRTSVVIHARKGSWNVVFVWNSFAQSAKSCFGAHHARNVTVMNANLSDAVPTTIVQLSAAKIVYLLRAANLVVAHSAMFANRCEAAMHANAPSAIFAILLDRPNARTVATVPVMNVMWCRMRGKAVKELVRIVISCVNVELARV